MPEFGGESKGEGPVLVLSYFIATVATRNLSYNKCTSPGILILASLYVFIYDCVLKKKYFFKNIFN
jgi:hypothetical protein